MVGIKEIIDGLIETVKSVRTAAVLFFGGAALLLLNLFLIWPFSLVSPLYITLAAVAALYGLVVMLVDTARFGSRKTQDWYGNRRTETARKVEAKRFDDEAVANLATLDDIQKRQLLWILRRGSQRVDQPVTELRQKHIMRSVEASWKNVDVVAEPIWAMREELLEKYKRVPDESKFPTYRYF
ncbi:hypothetical protein SAMN04488498_101397 [Mesorhizobium albiziae]|uniref:Uncharacterized protein n=1 Tax=Neomesorhizobium albiziae TaxID=335020 RepID=A0A1I3VEE8_9HYPH|nr:hypothetical protein [Mesorhizobium albiziae]GLS28855.1 hypothetical protein GCM10007937_05620 [Mesorhizobium albiziae]SFJ93645.1 hypothetical protein SAMN04488498_101397 [Mesorhizobium albiziae]